jgi:hypothetical protein
VTASYPTGVNVCLLTGAICSLAPPIAVSYTPNTLFVSNGNNNILEYTLPLSTAETPSTTLAMSQPPGPLAKDTNGNVFVATSSNPTTLAEISPPYSAITLSNSSGGPGVYGLAVAPNGDVALTAGFGGTFSVYAPPYSGTPTTNSSAAFGESYAVATDASSNVYVSYETGHVCSFIAPYTASASACTATSTTPYSMLASGNDLFVGELSSIQVFALPLTANALPIATLTSGVSYVKSLTLDNDGNLWVANAESGLGSVEEFAAPLSTGESPSVTLSMPSPGHSSYEPFDLAFDSEGNLYVLNHLQQGQAQGGGLLEFSSPITSSSVPAVALEAGALSQPLHLTAVPTHFTVSP